MGAGLCFQPTDDPSPECATEQAAHSGEEEVDARWQMPAETDVGGYDRAQERLTLSTDVEQSRTEGQPHAETRADQRSCLRSRFGDRAISANGALDQCRVRGADLVPGGDQRIRGPGEEVAELAADLRIGKDHQQCADEKCEHDRGNCDQYVGPRDDETTSTRLRAHGVCLYHWFAFRRHPQPTWCGTRSLAPPR